MKDEHMSEEEQENKPPVQQKQPLTKRQRNLAQLESSADKKETKRMKADPEE